MNHKFTYDVFLSHNTKDKVRVRQLAERMRSAGLSVWFDEWIIQPGDDIYLAIEKGLEDSRCLVLCMSAAAFGSDWVSLERNTVLFRDPTNRDRRFIPVLLTECNIPDTLRRHSYVDWRKSDETQLAKLLKACMPHEENDVLTRQNTAISIPTVEKSIDGFLDAIGLQHSIGQQEDRYYYLPQLFVPPAEFPIIQDLLNTNNFVLILGDPQIGKTYTALYLLYQYYLDGYHPFWESVRDLETSYDFAFRRLARPRFDLDDYVRRRLDGRNAIYIEDPWGKIHFDMPEEFTTSLEALINRVRISDAKLIITSRSGIFNRLKDLIGKEFAITLRAELVYGGVHRSYADEAKLHLLHNYYRMFHSNNSDIPSIAISMLSELHSPNSIRELCYLTRNRGSLDDYKQAVALSSDLDYQFSMEIISDVQPYPLGRRHRAALVLFLYVIDQAKQLFQAYSEQGRPSFQTMYDNIVKHFESLPLEPLQDALETLGDRVVRRRHNEQYFTERDIYQFTHPIYLDGVKRALQDAEVRRLMAHVVLALGDVYECNNCKYAGPFIHAYQYICNELDPQGPLCPQCHAWDNLSYVLEGISLHYALEPVYLSLGMIRYFNISIDNELLKVTILNKFLEQYTVEKLISMIVEYINFMCRYSKEAVISVNDVCLLDHGTALPNETLLNKITDQMLVLDLKQSAQLKVEALGSTLHDASTDIDF